MNKDPIPYAEFQMVAGAAFITPLLIFFYFNGSKLILQSFGMSLMISMLITHLIYRSRYYSVQGQLLSVNRNNINFGAVPVN